MNAELLEAIATRHPAPWRVGDPPTARFMWPIGDAADRVVAYVRERAVADLIVELRGRP
jgi:hypothetical protein